jgi:site-specific DNA recombinase
MRVDAYIRVSRVAGRKGESFISLDEQRRAIEAYAAAHKIEIADWHQDLDQSGGTLDRPEFQIALDRCRTGQTGGLIAAKLDRITRSTVGLGTLIDEARAGGWNLIAVDFGLDLFSPNGKLVADVLAAVAEWERSRRGDDWEAARRNAVERGIANGRAPYGYRKSKHDKRLEIQKREADRVREAFRLRAQGEPFAMIGRRFGWGHSQTRQLLANIAYIGVARSGDYAWHNPTRDVIVPFPV